MPANLVTLDRRAFYDLSTIRAALARSEKLSNLATLFALFRVGSLARTRIVARVAAELGARVSRIRPLVKVYRGTLSKMRVRVWHGFAARLRWLEAPTVVKARHPRARFMRLADGYEGLFHEHPSGKLTEATVSIEPAVEAHAEPICGEVFDLRFADLYWRDYERRLRSRGWRPGG